MVNTFRNWLYDCHINLDQEVAQIHILPPSFPLTLSLSLCSLPSLLCVVHLLTVHAQIRFIGEKHNPQENKTYCEEVMKGRESIRKGSFVEIKMQKIVCAKLEQVSSHSGHLS